MSNFIASVGGGGDYAQPKIAENQHAACFAIAALGKVERKKFQSEDMELVNMVALGFTFGKDEEGRDLTLWKQYKFSYNEKAALRKDLEAWRDHDFTDEEIQQFPLTKVLGQKCTITVGQTSGGNPKITKIKPPRDGNDITLTVGDTWVFDIDEPSENYDKLPAYMRNMIKTEEVDTPVESVSDIPF